MSAQGPSNVDLTIRGDVERLHVGPDDAVVFKLIADYPIDPETLEFITRQLRDRFMGLEWVDHILVLDNAKVEVAVLKNGAQAPDTAPKVNVTDSRSCAQ